MTQAREGFVLAGGLSRRMGVDKARIRLGDGVEMAVQVALTCREAGLKPVIIRRRVADPHPWRWPDGTAMDVRYEPQEPERHPLFGVAFALAHASEELALILPCDVPWLSVAAVETLLAPGRAVVAHDGQRTHPLLAVLPTAWAADARTAAEAGASVRSFVAGLPRVHLPAAAVRNANTPEDLQ